MEIKSFLISFLHIRSWWDLFISFVAAYISFLLAYFTDFVIDHHNVFIMITVVVFGDFVFGVAANIKNFQTHKALKVAWYFVGYNMLAYIILIIERGNPSAFWLSEAVIMPIMVGQVVSILKNLRKLRILPPGIISDILDKIDKHKDRNAAE